MGATDLGQLPRRLGSGTLGVRGSGNLHAGRMQMTRPIGPHLVQIDPSGWCQVIDEEAWL